MACDVSWKSSLSKLNDENVLLKTQVDYVVQEKENIKLEYQKLFNSIKAIRVQHQKEVNELIKSISQKTYAYGDMRSKLKDKLKTFEKGKGLDKYGYIKNHKKTIKNKQARTRERKSAQKPEAKARKSQIYSQLQELVAAIFGSSCLARGLDYPLGNLHYWFCACAKCTSRNSLVPAVTFPARGVWSSNSVRRPKSKDNKSKNKVLKNTNDKSSSAHVRKVSSSVRIDSSKRETMNSTVCQSNASVLNTKTINVVNDGSNIVCVSCGKDVFMLSHEKCVARYALSKDSRRVLKAYDWQSETAKNFIEKFIGTILFGNDHFAAITGYGDYVQGSLTICHVYYVEGLGHILFSVGKFYDGDLEVAFRSSTCYVQNLEGDDLLTGSRESNLYTISISDLAASSPAEAIATTCFTQNRSGVHTRYNKTPYELIRGRKPNVQHFHVFAYLCYPTNDRDDLGGLTLVYLLAILTMASECNNSGPGLNCLNFQDSSKELNEILSQQDLDNLFGPLYEEYYASSTSEVSNNSAANTLDDEDTPSPSSVVVDDNDAPQMVTS
ncbi:hypothetical protein Tco_1326265 [Tanacetum coccineum]